MISLVFLNVIKPLNRKYGFDTMKTLVVVATLEKQSKEDKTHHSYHDIQLKVAISGCHINAYHLQIFINGSEQLAKSCMWLQLQYFT